MRGLQNETVRNAASPSPGAPGLRDPAAQAGPQKRRSRKPRRTHREPPPQRGIAAGLPARRGGPLRRPGPLQQDANKIK